MRGRKILQTLRARSQADKGFFGHIRRMPRQWAKSEAFANLSAWLIASHPKRTCRHGALHHKAVCRHVSSALSPRAYWPSPLRTLILRFCRCFLSLWFHQMLFWLFSSGIICKNSSYKVRYSTLLGVMQPKNFSYEKAQDGTFSGKVSTKRLH